MSHSNNLRLSDVRRAFRLLGDCRDLGRDRGDWITRAVSGLRDSLGMVMSVGALFPQLSMDAVQNDLEFWDVGWPNENDRATWMGLLASGRAQYYATARESMAIPGRLSIRTRGQLVPDQEWYSSIEYVEDRGPLGQDDLMLAHLRVENAGTLVFSLNRAVGDRPFSVRDRRFARLFFREVLRMAGTDLAVDKLGPIGSLPPRMRQVLEALVEGDSEKQIALRLGLSRHTVHDHVKELHRRFGVASRGELLAFYHRRNRPTGD